MEALNDLEKIDDTNDLNKRKIEALDYSAGRKDAAAGKLCESDRSSAYVEGYNAYLKAKSYNDFQRKLKRIREEYAKLTPEQKALMKEQLHIRHAEYCAAKQNNIEKNNMFNFITTCNNKNSRIKRK